VGGLRVQGLRGPAGTPSVEQWVEAGRAVAARLAHYLPELRRPRLLRARHADGAHHRDVVLHKSSGVQEFSLFKRIPRRNSTTEPRAAVDSVGRLAANAREHKNGKYKKFYASELLVFPFLCSRGRAYGASRRLPRSPLTLPTEKYVLSPCVSVSPCPRVETSLLFS
jgi:hypothetical protein